MMGRGAGLILGLCWFGSIALVDRSGGIGLELIVGFATLAALDSVMTAGTGWIAGFWASLAFLSGGLPPLCVIALAIVVIGRTTARSSIAFIIPPIVTVALWSLWTSLVVSPELCATALALPFTQKSAWFLGPAVLAIGLPFSPFAALCLVRSTRASWSPAAGAWSLGWFQVAIASLIAGSAVPGLADPARVIVLAGVAIAAAAGLDSAQGRADPVGDPRILCPLRRRNRTVALRHDIWLVCLELVSGLLPRPRNRHDSSDSGGGCVCWLALAKGNAATALATLVLIAVGIKFVYWGYYVPEWNYRYSQGPWRAQLLNGFPANGPFTRFTTGSRTWRSS